MQAMEAQIEDQETGRQGPASEMGGPASPLGEPERRLWTAVLVQAIAEWQNGPVRVSRAAAEFLFQNGEDFAMVCEGAGLEPSRMRAKLAGLPQRRMASEDWRGNGNRQ